MANKPVTGIFFAALFLTVCIVYQMQQLSPQKILKVGNPKQVYTINNVQKSDASVPLLSMKVNVQQLKKGEKRTCWRNAFNDTVLVMNFNYPYYESMEILHLLYDNVFGKVLSCGPAKTSNQTGAGPDILYEEKAWFFRYRCLTKAIQLYPDYKGYIYSNDDIIINWWNLLQLDRSKVWQSGIVDFRQTPFNKPISRWMWWKTEMGLIACKKYYKTLQKLSRQKSKEYLRSYTNYIKNGKGVPRCAKGWTDMFHVPGRFAKQYVKLANIAYEHKLFLEIAGNNIIRSLDRVENFEFLNGTYLPDLHVTDIAAPSFWQVYNMNLTFIHPIKFNLKLESDRKLTRALTENWIVWYKNLLTNC